jgi:hypothetical protein
MLTVSAVRKTRRLPVSAGVILFIPGVIVDFVVRAAFGRPKDTPLFDRPIGSMFAFSSSASSN